MAVGDSAALLWADGRWRVTARSSPYDGVSCAAPDWCMAVGIGRGSGHAVYGLWNGRAWAAGQMAQPAEVTGAVSMNSVSCVSSRFCIAVGTYSVSDQGNPPAGGGLGQAVAELWDGTGWQISWLASPAGLNDLTAVSCASPQACMAIGTEGPFQAAQPVAEHWDGSGWLAQDMPMDATLPGETAYPVEARAVSCATATACMAVGSFGGNAAGEVWDSSAWRVEQVPVPDQSAQLVGVSCATAGRCVAVGSDPSQIRGAACGAIAIADVWNGQGWQSLTPWNPAQCFPT
jgi:hypothetical protein